VCRHFFLRGSQKGFQAGDQLVGFTSEQSHYTIERAATVLGMGLEGNIKVPSPTFPYLGDNTKPDFGGAGKVRQVRQNDSGGTGEGHRKGIRHILLTSTHLSLSLPPPPLLYESLCFSLPSPESVLQAKAEGKTPVYINATCGTTVLGAYDPLNAIADIAKKYGIWYGQKIVLSPLFLASFTRRQAACGRLLGRPRALLPEAQAPDGRRGTRGLGRRHGHQVFRPPAAVRDDRPPEAQYATQLQCLPPGTRFARDFSCICLLLLRSLLPVWCIETAGLQISFHGFSSAEHDC
jgi:hypothetical protein